MQSGPGDQSPGGTDAPWKAEPVPGRGDLSGTGAGPKKDQYGPDRFGTGTGAGAWPPPCLRTLTT